MCIKKKILLTLPILTFIILMFTFSSYAMEINKTDFSEYLNCYKNDIYTEPTYIKPLDKTNYYNVGTECYNVYKTKEIKAEKPKYSKIGFKVNDEFYMSAYYLNETGTYKIEVFFYEKNKDGYYQARGNAIESFYVFIDLGFELTQNKTNFYYEYYENSDEFIEDVSNSFNKNVELTLATQNSLKSNFSSYNNESKAIGLNVSYKSVSYNFTINLVPLKEIEANFYDLADVVANATVGQAYPYDKSITNSTYLNDILESSIINNIANKLKLADGQKVDIEITNNVNIKSFGSNLYQTYSLPITITEVNKKDEYSFSLPILIYKPNYLSEDKDFMKIEFESDEYISGQNIPNNYYTYLEFNENDVVYRDYENIPVLNNFSLNEVKNVIIYNLNYQGIEKNFTNNVQIVVEVSKPKILTRYNYIVLPNRESITFQNQIKVLCDISYRTSYDIVDIDGEDWLSIEVYSTDTNEQIISKNVKISYIKQNNSFFSKILKGYGDFLRKIFA